VRDEARHAGAGERIERAEHRMTLQVAGLRCPRCGTGYPVAHHDLDCEACRPQARVNLAVDYGARLNAACPVPPANTALGMWRWAEFLPVARPAAVTMGEGGTPLTPLPRIAQALGLAGLWAKDESRNPTWSFKDRLASAAVSAARALGARVIATSSSGNAGAAAAAYAARAGLPCVVFTFQGAAGPMVIQMRAYGAMVLTVRDKAQRWTLLERGVRELGWFPTSPFFGPAVGSNPLGLEGYKTIAYEIVEELGGRAPDWCVLPVCYGDALAGMWRGFLEMKAWGWIERLPRMAAAEVYGSAERALAEALSSPPYMPKTHDSIAVSIGAQQSTWQAIEVLRASGGRALRVSNEAMLRWQRRLATEEGLWGEASSVAPWAAIEQLRAEGAVETGHTVVGLFTAAGLKDPAPTAREMPDLPVIDGTFGSALETLARHYRFDAEA